MKKRKLSFRLDKLRRLTPDELREICRIPYEQRTWQMCASFLETSDPDYWCLERRKKLDEWGRKKEKE